MKAFFHLRPEGCRSLFFGHKMVFPHRMMDGSVRRMIFFPLLRNCCHSFCAVRKMDGHRMTSSRFPHSCYSLRNSFFDRKMDVPHRRTNVRRMMFFFLRFPSFLRNFYAARSYHYVLHKRFGGLMNIHLFHCLHGSDNRHAGHSRCDCRWSSSCGCCRKTCTLRQRRMMRQALPSFSV